MNKGDLINEVAKTVSTKKGDHQAAVGCIFDTITKTPKKNGFLTRKNDKN
ncbi:MAG: hypothetical protein JXL81_12795 [Deltaproteobacteria bacterium]|nr:hypothetical protein [Deltaproteobacteria bacterium]